jgi:hypothetical protein
VVNPDIEKMIWRCGLRAITWLNLLTTQKNMGGERSIATGISYTP